jgi:hypothetical protein
MISSKSSHLRKQVNTFGEFHFLTRHTVVFGYICVALVAAQLRQMAQVANCSTERRSPKEVGMIELVYPPFYLTCTASVDFLSSFSRNSDCIHSTSLKIFAQPESGNVQILCYSNRVIKAQLTFSGDIDRTFKQDTLVHSQLEFDGKGEPKYSLTLRRAGQHSINYTISSERQQISILALHNSYLYARKKLYPRQMNEVYILTNYC